MCVEIRMPDGATLADTGQMLGALGTDVGRVIVDAQYNPAVILNPASCLCPVDLPATFAAHGYSLRPGFDVGVDWIAVRSACSS